MEDKEKGSFIMFSATDPNEPEVGHRGGSIIVKVQLPLEWNTVETPPALVYDRTRELQHYVDASLVADRMKGRTKAFFYATFSYGQFVFGEEAPAQAW